MNSEPRGEASTLNTEIAQASLVEERAYWLAFSQIAYVGPVRLRRLYDHFGSLQTAWDAPASDIGRVLDSRALDHFSRARKRTSPLELLGAVERRGMQVVTQIDEHYPRLLAQIPAAPAVLYVRGSLSAKDDTAVALVGTRRCTPYGRRVAADIARELAAEGVTIVSGMARGIDGSAHQGALEGGGRTIAVLASGVDVIYPPEHRLLAERIVEQGALISDYPPGTKPDAPNFPARNRIISGLALGTVVIEAPRRSGALITVDFAADQGREVFVVPGNAGSEASQGSNALLRDGARAVMSASDILEDLGLSAAGERDGAQEAAAQLSDLERRLIAIIGSEPRHLDEILVAAGLPVAEGAALMTMLELQGLVRNVGSQHYVSNRSANRRLL